MIFFTASECPTIIEVKGRGAIKTVFPTAKNFTAEPIRSWNTQLVIYKTEDNDMALHFKDGQWEISQLQNNNYTTAGQINFATRKIARTNVNGLKCPTEVESWQYWDDATNSWVDAGPRIQLTGITCKSGRFYFSP